MSKNRNLPLHPEGPQSILVIGCGLIGTSLALALKQAFPSFSFDGVELDSHHRDIARRHGVFDHLYETLPAKFYDLAILSVPIDVACTLLGKVGQLARLVMDVCSVKVPICDVATNLGYGTSFAPTHPMAGLATEGPEQAHADLFVDRAWLCMDGWPACKEITFLLERIRARIEYIPTPADHDEAMAAVSHAIHLVSLSAMLAYGTTQAEPDRAWAALTGPGFRDITRLSASPSGFWVSTLLANAPFVTRQLERVITELQSFQSALSTNDGERLKERLETARLMNEEWRKNLR